MGIDLEDTARRIQAALEAERCWSTVVDASSQQNFVDIRWAARKAAKALNVQVTVTVDRNGRHDGLIPVSVAEARTSGDKD